MRHLAFTLVLLCAGTARAGLAIATFQSTGVEYPQHGSLAFGGEPIWMTITMDNGGPPSLANQSWGPQDFISFRFDIQQGSGNSYTFMSDEIDSVSTGLFQTDANGQLLSTTVIWGASPAPNALNIFRTPSSETVLSEGQGAWDLNDTLWAGGYPVVLSTGGSYIGSVADNPSLSTNWSVAAVPEASQVLCFLGLSLAAITRAAVKKLWQ